MASGTNGSTRARHRKDKEHSRSKLASPEGCEPFGKRNETEEEYDARPEHEENVRLAAARERELERPKRQHEQETQSTNGVRLKGFFSLSFFSASVRSPFLRVAGLTTAYATARVASCYLKLGPGPFPFRTSRSLVLST